MSHRVEVKTEDQRKEFFGMLMSLWRDGRGRVVVTGNHVIIGDTEYIGPGLGNACYHIDKLLAWMGGKK